MYFHSARLCWISLFFTFAVRRCSSARTPESPELRLVQSVTCAPRRLKAVLGSSVNSDIRVTDVTGVVTPVTPVGQPEAQSCGVKLSRDKNHSLLFHSRYDSCYARVEGHTVVVSLQVQLTGDDRWFQVNLSCPLIKRSNERTRFVPALLPRDCDTHRDLRVKCGREGISSAACSKLGCCYDSDGSVCYYRLNACSLDGHFVFSVETPDGDPPVDLRSLVVKGQPQCVPVLTTPNTAVFKVPVMDCGVRRKLDGEVVTYELEVEELDAGGTDTHAPFSVQVQCEYEAADLQRAADLRSLYAATNPPPVVALGTISVHMRLATDASFTSFYPEDQLPLTLPLRKPAFVEVSIGQPSPDPTLSLHVRDCFAYPASRHSVWTLLYAGCPNPLDNMRSSVPVDKQGKTTSHSQVRRFDVKTFAFLDRDRGRPSVEEMFFYCWVEICTEDADCAQHCTIISSEGERRRREAPSDLVQLVSLGPLLLGHNITEESVCVQQKKETRLNSPKPLHSTGSTNNKKCLCEPFYPRRSAFQVTVYVLAAVGAALLSILLISSWSNIRRRQKTKAQQTCDAQGAKSPSPHLSVNCSR